MDRNTLPGGGSQYNTPLGARQSADATCKNNLNFLYFFHNVCKYNKGKRKIQVLSFH